MSSSKARKYHPNHFEGTIFNLGFCIEPKLSVKQDDRKKTAAYRQGAKKNILCEHLLWKVPEICSCNKKIKKKKKRKIRDFPNREPCIVILQDWNVINEDGPLCQGLLHFLFYFDVKSR